VTQRVAGRWFYINSGCYGWEIVSQIAQITVSLSRGVLFHFSVGIGQLWLLDQIQIVTNSKD
jgi:hypothetical protein